MPRHFTHLAAALALLAATGRAHSQTASPRAISFTRTAEGFIVVPATVGDDTPVHFLFDTGSGFDVLAPSLVRKLHGTPGGHFTGFRMFGDRIDIPLFVVPKLAIGPLVKSNALVGTWDVLDSLHIDGIVSMNDFRRQPFTLDFVHGMLYFETAATLAARRAAGVATPLQADDVRNMSLDLFARFAIGDTSAQCSIDTGSPVSTVHLRYMQALGLSPDSPDVRKHEARSVTGGIQVTYGANIPRLALADHPNVALTHPRVSLADIIYDCVVGVEFWAGRVVTMDVPNRQLIVAKDADGGR